MAGINATMSVAAGLEVGSQGKWAICGMASPAGCSGTEESGGSGIECVDSVVWGEVELADSTSPSPLGFACGGNGATDGDSGIVSNLDLPNCP